MYPILLVGLGGFIGAVTRYLGYQLGLQTWHINVAGCLLFGLLMSLCIRYVGGTNASLQALLFTGFLGSLTTYSTYNYEMIVMLQDGRWLHATVLVVGQLLLGLAAFYLGFYIAR